MAFIICKKPEGCGAIIMTTEQAHADLEGRSHAQCDQCGSSTAHAVMSIDQIDDKTHGEDAKIGAIAALTNRIACG